jgi:Carboxypeptidase regulatory-like domain/TonB-dependent Receptor Plug Domain
MEHRVRFYTLAALLCTAAIALCQVNTGTISGIVTDPTGAAIPNVQVIVVQTETNFETRVVTNAEGLYRVQSLLPGTYRLTFEGAGFRRLVQDGLTLHVGQVLPVNGTLEIGQLAESVQVSAQSTLLETETSSTGTVTGGDVLYKMPLYQRYVLNALNLMPGMTMNGYAYGGSLGGFNVAGQRSTGTAVFEDGVLGNDPLSGSGTDIKPVENSVEEVKVLTGTLPAEYGHTTGGVLTVVKKGGTNTIHGTAADLGRTRSMTHRQFFNLCKTSDP